MLSKANIVEVYRRTRLWSTRVRRNSSQI